MKEQFVKCNCKYKETFNNLTPMLIIDIATGNIKDVNSAACNYYLYTKKQLLSMNISDINTLSQEDIFKEMKKAELENRNFFRFKHKLFNGEIRDVEVHNNILKIGDKDLLLSFIYDIKEKSDLQKEYKLNKVYFNSLFDNCPEAIAIVDDEFKVLNVNDKFRGVFQYDLVEILNEDITKILSKKRIDNTIYNFKELIIKGKCIKEQVRIKKRDSSTLDVLLLAFPLLLDRKFIGAYFVYSDISETKEKENKIKMLTYNDVLTGLFNRKFFLENLNYEIFKNKNKEKLAVVLLKVNEFKEIKDALGYLVGEKVLKEFALRLRLSVSIEDIIARLSEDDFAILISKIKDLEEIDKLYNNIIGNLQNSFLIDKYEFQITTSMGFVIYPDDGMEFMTLIRKADIAMNKCKTLSINSPLRFEDSLDKEIQEEFWIKNDLLKVIIKEELFLDYQPIYNTTTNKLVGVEALIRWNHKEKGIISPARFIPIAEKNGMIYSIGEWVLLEACRQNKKWQELGYEPIYISINISILQLEKSNFIKMIKRVLKESMLDPQYIQLEITESFFTPNYKLVQNTIKEIRNLGIKMAIDDFGTGYSSLEQLCQLNINNIKIDRMFIHEVDKDINKSKIVNTIISLAKSLSINLIAEGVETEEELKFLNTNGCTIVQGYLFSKPVEPYKIQELLSQ